MKELREMSLGTIIDARLGVLSGGYGTQAGINFFHDSHIELKRRRIYSLVRKLELKVIKDRRESSK